ncbi:tRNA (guanosine(37)-N1)-methyltransferase TrmD [Hyphobacterium sp. CCMP332]|nr:tRNA (guanosine(37)-N1)-methyltransferase TrmD [Hyphobacterium sp. CCMP332]
MRIDIITCLPTILDSYFNQSIIKRAREKNHVDLQVHDLRVYSNDKHKKVDDYAYGFGAGMVLQIQPIDDCISSLKSKRNYDAVIYLSPDGSVFNQGLANEWSTKFKNIILLCGHYKGVDERVREHLVDFEISIGDYVLSGGELAAAVVSDALIRLIPGVLNDETSALSDSFQDDLIAPPVYSRPAEYKSWKVPEVLKSGNQKKVEEWNLNMALQRTKERRPELYQKIINHKDK